MVAHDPHPPPFLIGVGVFTFFLVIDRLYQLTDLVITKSVPFASHETGASGFAARRRHGPGERAPATRAPAAAGWFTEEAAAAFQM